MFFQTDANCSFYFLSIQSAFAYQLDLVAKSQFRVDELEEMVQAYRNAPGYSSNWDPIPAHVERIQELKSQLETKSVVIRRLEELITHQATQIAELKKQIQPALAQKIVIPDSNRPG